MKYYPKYQIITKEKLYTALFFLQVRSGEGKIFSEKVNKSTTFEQNENCLKGYTSIVSQLNLVANSSKILLEKFKTKLS